MILYHWQGAAPNFGDELNTVIWPRLLPGFFDSDTQTRFLGIGSVLDSRHPWNALKLVAGSGYGGYEPKPRLDDRWVIHWVRGPRTASALGLPLSLALGDPALLLPLALGRPDRAEPTTQIGFMPHFETIARGAWGKVAALTGITLIDPRDPPLLVIEAIRRCRLLLSEALHGAIVADALRIPWVGVRPLAGAHRAKWDDWSASMGMTLRMASLPASSPAEWIGVRRITGHHAVRMLIDHSARRMVCLHSDRMIGRAADALRRAAETEPQLSPDAVLDHSQTRMMDRLAIMQRRPLAQAFQCGEPAGTRSFLRGHDESAYQLGPIV